MRHEYGSLLKKHDALIALLRAHAIGGSSLPPLAPGQALVASIASSPLPVAQGVPIVFPVQAFGALGNGVHNDRAAITAADGAAFAAGGGIVYFEQPLVAYMTDGELTPSPGVIWEGTAVELGQCAIKASAVMRSVLHVDNYTTTLSPTPNRFTGLTIDANGLADNACLSDGDFLAVYERMFFTGAVRNGQRSDNHSQPLILSAVAPGAGAPAGVTISQPDPNFSGFISAGVKSMVARIVNPGGLDVATYQMSFDGGITFQAATQLASALSNINLTNAAAYGPPTGVRFAFPAQAYPAGGTYTFSATVQADDFTGLSINADRRFFDCYWRNNGTVFATAALAPAYTGSARVVTVAAGTVSTAAGSQVITGTGTDFMSFNAQEGDLWKINGQIFATASVLDHITMVVPANATPSFTLAGLGFACGVGSGYHEDGSSENVRGMIYAGSAGVNASADFRFGGAQGPVFTQTRNELYGFAAYAVGSTVIPTTGSTLALHPHVESGAAGSVSIYSIAGAPVTAIEPPELWTNAGPGGGYKIINGVQFPINGGASTLVLIYTERFNSGAAVVLTTGAETLTVPGLESATGTSLILLAPANDVIMTAAPLFPGAAALPNGVHVRLKNQSPNFSVLLQADAQTGSGLVSKSRFMLLGANSYVDFESFNGKFYQIAPESNTFASQSGNPGEYSSKTLVTVNNTPTTIWDFNAVNSGISSGTSAVWDIVARSNGVVNLASWLGMKAMWDVNGGPGGLLASAIVAGANGVTAWGTNAGAPPAGWAITLGFDGANQFAQIRVTGDNTANNVHWKIYVRHLSPPV